MKAAVFYGTEDVRVEEKELRGLHPDEVLIQVKAAGICGTDIHIYQGKKGATEVKPPVILGHEFSGVVTAVGDHVEIVHVGNVVTVDPNFMCGMCEECRKGNSHFCDKMQATGVDFDGGFGQYCIVLEKQVYVLPDSVSFEDAAMCEPVGCCIHGIDLADIKLNDTVMIIGGGTIGLIMLQLAKLSGAGKVIVVEPVEEKRALAARLGADLTINPFASDVHQRLKENKVYHVHVAVECCGAKETMENAIKYVSKGGHVMLFGLSDPDMLLPVKPFDIFRKEITIKSSFVNPHTHGRAASLITEGKLNLKDLITARIPLEQLADFLQVPNKTGKTIVCPDK